MLKHYLPILDWLPTYNRFTLSSDAVAAIVVTLMIIPQALAYALLAGLPAVTGLYASILPLLAIPCSVPVVPWRSAPWR